MKEQIIRLVEPILQILPFKEGFGFWIIGSVLSYVVLRICLKYINRKSSETWQSIFISIFTVLVTSWGIFLIAFPIIFTFLLLTVVYNVFVPDSWLYAQLKNKPPKWL